MKTNLHPQYHPVTVKCACGASFQTGSTKDKIQVEICSECHPFFTGEMKFVDTMGRVEKFQAKQTFAAGATNKRKKKSKQATTSSKPKTLKEMLAQSAAQPSSSKSQ